MFARKSGANAFMESFPVGVRGLNHKLSVTYHCQFHYFTNRKEMVKKVRDRMKHRHKKFLRFKATVDDENSWEQASNEHET